MLNIVISNKNINGVMSYVYHLILGLQAACIPYLIIKPHNKTEGFFREYIGGLKYANMSYEKILNLQQPFLIVDQSNIHGPLGFLEKLYKKGAVFIVHREKEYKEGNQDVLDGAIVVRKSLLKIVPGSFFIKHPYRIKYGYVTSKKKLAICGTRIAKEKNSDIVIDCIENEKSDIHLIGPLMPFYGMHLKRKFPGWKDHWKGVNKPNEMAEVTSEYMYSIDLTNFKNDGAGTQYTFLEAIDSGTIPIVHKDWLGGHFVEGETCLAAEDKESLMTCFRKNIKDKNKNFRLLMQHNAEKIAKEIFQKCLES